MKRFLTSLLLVAIGFILYATNPTADDFDHFIRERVEQRLAEDAGDSGLGRMLTRLGASVAGSVAARIAKRSDYGLISVYTVDVGADGQPDEQWTFVGIAGRFIQVESPPRR